MTEVSEIIEFLKLKTGTDNVSETSDIGNDLGVDGDDYDELILEFSQRYKVDVSSCLWYFHFSEEGSWNSIGRQFYKSPDESVKHIPVTPVMLSNFTKSGKWDIDYPEHNIPKRRYDILVNKVLVVGLILYLLWRCLL